MTRRLANTISAVLMTLLVACDAREEPAADYVFPFEPGLAMKIKAFGRYYYMEAIKADGDYVTWKLRWNDRVVSVNKTYKGIFAVYESELDHNFVNEFETASIDRLFPLAVGNQASFKGYRISKDEGTETPMWVHIVVREKEAVKVRDEEFQTYVIEITNEYERPDRTVTVTRTIWFAPELGFNLKGEYRSDEDQFQYYVLSIYRPDEDNGENWRRRNLGTVRI